MEDEMDKVAQEIERFHLTDTSTIKHRKLRILQNITIDKDELTH